METFNDVIMSEKPTLVDFFATWCQPCKMMHPVLEQVKATLGDRIRIIKVDVDQHKQIAAAYQIQCKPSANPVRAAVVPREPVEPQGMSEDALLP